GKFQSTRPRGARHQQWRPRGDRPSVSIHAPAWGATSPTCTSWDIRIGFNPRARVGRDAIPAHHLEAVFQFQSTRPRGARRQYLLSLLAGVGVSIHAPAWGATVRLESRTAINFPNMNVRTSKFG